MLTLMLMLSIISSMMFIVVKHPLSFGLILLIQSTLASLITGMLSINFWFSYILFLVMVGGMLILFIYMTSIASNEKFKFSTPMLLTCLLMIFISGLFLLLDQSFVNSMSINSDIMSYKMSINESLKKYMNWPNNLILLTMMIYLLLTLIVVVKITKIKNGPLRQKF